MNVKQVLLSICERAIRNCPWSGKLWNHYANAKVIKYILYIYIYNSNRQNLLLLFF